METVALTQSLLWSSLLNCFSSQGRPTGQKTTLRSRLAWAWWWTRRALLLNRASRLCRAKQRSCSSETGGLSTPPRSLLKTWTCARAIEGIKSASHLEELYAFLLLLLELYCIYAESAGCLFYCSLPTGCLFSVYSCVFRAHYFVFFFYFSVVFLIFCQQLKYADRCDKCVTL